MAKKKKPKYRGGATVEAKSSSKSVGSFNPAALNSDTPVASSQSTVAFRETIESIVVAFVLAFLFRTFEAEAFVIPTGSMSPSLQGQHKDVKCTECGYRFRTTASTEGEDREARIAQLNNPNSRLSPQQRSHLRDLIQGSVVMAGMCPNCRQTMLYRDDGLPNREQWPAYISQEEVDLAPSYPGDRILVNKYGFGFHEPERWDVVVFKFPGNGEMNYIKRLVGRPNEELQVYQGDIFIRPLEGEAPFAIERKPPHVARAMMQSVHDNAHDPAILYEAGWPLRWSDAETAGWETKAEVDGITVDQTFEITATKNADPNAPLAWLRYRHLVPSDDDWANARIFRQTGSTRDDQEEWLEEATPELITDFNPYNARIMRSQLMNGGRLEVEPYQFGMHWVGDLAVRCEAQVHQAQGELYLDLVEGGVHFTCQIDLSTGTATLAIDGSESFTATASTPLSAPGDYELLFANIDDQLMLWVDGELMPFGENGEQPGAAPYDLAELFGDREVFIPATSDADPGDLAPVGIGARGATLSLDHLEVLRDIYYIAAKHTDSRMPSRYYGSEYQIDFANWKRDARLPDGTNAPRLHHERQLFRDPDAWPRYLTRRKRAFEIQEKQYFVMGDNSPESLDCRLWSSPNGNAPHAIPGGAYLNERLLTGEAVCVFWPHSWGSIPGLRMLPGFPNFWDMRVVR